jgi:hypothetical protein
LSSMLCSWSASMMPNSGYATTLHGAVHS